MLLGYQLVQDQSTKLAITPELKQSIHILTMSAEELIRYLQEQEAENPVLELEFRRGYDMYGGRSRGAIDNGREPDPLRNARQAQDTLESNLKSQLRLLSLPKEVYRIAVFMAGNLSDDGYLDLPVIEIRRKLGVSEELLRTALEALQSLEPAGVGCRDLRECLLLQIVRDPAAPPFAYEIADRFLPELAYRKLEKAAAALNIPVEKARLAADYIRGLNPRPGLAFAALETQYIVPDVIVESHEDGFTVSMHPVNLPRLSINSSAREWVILRGSAEASSYLNSCVRSARWLVRSVEKRNRTLMRVVMAIMEEQRRFLAEGIRGIAPMKMNTISAKLNVHESTVSRAVQGKFVLTPHGVLPLKYFFSAGLSTMGGGGISSRSVKARIKELIDEEDKHRPYSDQHIADVLGAEGIRLSRRTVAKYREQMQIMPSALRKRR
ncbi:RNA polymerase sigma-54 factor [Paenibacillus ihbetae]|uniref:RNA polymerase sigma-54 factor n=1 Tax=Paenibacillus ihbetae TaxID=1870820 RepID=A0ABX3K0C2_9BACL|nr:RNA polymerase sigma-54 factor [Paenibacillus ihbetae]